MATVSVSSEQDLKEFGFKNVFVVPMGVSVKPLEKVEEKESVPPIILIGRLKRHKLVVTEANAMGTPVFLVYGTLLLMEK